MCRNCVKQEYPQRERLCAENGAYILNFAGCSKCGQDSNRAPDALKSMKYLKTDNNEEENKEVVTFDHCCAKCGHLVAGHSHEFWIEDNYQEYRMECLLCGMGEDSLSILPKDPKKVSQIDY